MSKHSAKGTTWEKQRQRVLKRDAWTCLYCGDGPLQGSNATVDHLNPISLNPNTTYHDHELVTACRSCNGRKQDKQGIRIHYRNPRWT